MFAITLGQLWLPKNTDSGLSMGRVIHEWKHSLLAPPLPLVSVNNSQFCSSDNNSDCAIDVTRDAKSGILVKPNPITPRTGKPYVTCSSCAHKNSVLATVACLLLLNTNLLRLLTTYSYLILHHSKKLLPLQINNLNKYKIKNQKITIRN